MAADYPALGRKQLPSWRECRAAARSIRRAEYGVEAMATARPRGVIGFFRGRGPLPIMLYVAAREGRLVWRGPDSLALLQRPADQPVRPALGGARTVLLRQLDRHWEFLLFAAPPVVLLVAAAAVVVGRDLVGLDVAVTGGLLLAATALAYVAVTMTSLVLFGLRSLYRQLGRKPPAGPITARTVPGQRWTMALCHQLDPLRSNELLSNVSLRLKRLIRGEARSALRDTGATAHDIQVTELLVCLLSGVTTQHMREDVAEWSSAVTHDADGVRVRQPDLRGGADPKRIFDKGGFFFWYWAGVAVVIAVEALLVAAWEQEAGPGDGCPRRPSTYGLALRWLAQRLLLTDPAGLAPGTARAVAVGWLTSLVGLTGLAVTFVAVRRYVEHWRAAVDDVNARFGRDTRVLVLVANPHERAAMLAAVQAVTGTEPRLVQLRNHIVFDLGMVSNAHVLLAMTGQGAVGPTAAAIAASALISQVAPDYLIAVGVCYGLRENEQRLGDVIVSRQLRAVDHRKVSDAGAAGRGDSTAARSKPVVLIRGDFVTASTALLNRFQAADHDWRRRNFTDEGGAVVGPRQGTRVDVHYGTMLSLSVLLDSRQMRDELLGLDPEASGGEMEGAGIYAAAAPEKVDWIVAKAIADWGYDKTDEVQRMAADNVADFVVHAIRSGALDEAVVPVNAR